MGCRSISGSAAASTPARDAAAGVLPEGVTVFDDDYPGVARLDPALRDALRRATRAASTDGIELYVNSGWRSRAHQEQLLDEAVSRYGSAAAAAHWVAGPDDSLHVTGRAVDIGGSGAAAWLSRHGAAYGLCRIYRNEPWHVELRAGAADRGCPPMFPDPSDDPRLRS